jgi:Skp family chaperone for outer membrane proteins
VKKLTRKAFANVAAGDAAGMLGAGNVIHDSPKRRSDSMAADNLDELVQKLRERVANIERTVRETEQASVRSMHTEKALEQLRESLKSAQLQLMRLEQRQQTRA